MAKRSSNKRPKRRANKKNVKIPPTFEEFLEFILDTDLSGIQVPLVTMFFDRVPYLHISYIRQGLFLSLGPLLEAVHSMQFQV